MARPGRALGAAGQGKEEGPEVIEKLAENFKAFWAEQFADLTPVRKPRTPNRYHKPQPLPFGALMAVIPFITDSYWS